jgi:hypothetical protein
MWWMLHEYFPNRGENQNRRVKAYQLSSQKAISVINIGYTAYNDHLPEAEPVPTGISQYLSQLQIEYAIIFTIADPRVRCSLFL